MEGVITMTGLRLPSREAVAKFLISGSCPRTCPFEGVGYGPGFGYGSGYGVGYGEISGEGCVIGTGEGYKSGVGSGSGSGKGSSTGEGYGFGMPDLLKYEGCQVDYIDSIPCVICAIRRNYANVLIIGDDLQIKQAYVARVGDSFGHGESIREAYEAARLKELEDMPVEERIAAFVKEHPDPDKAYGDLFAWHHTLTGSCEFGRKEWCRSHGYQPDGSITVRTFIEQTMNDYGGTTIKQLAKEYNIDL